MKTPTLLKTFKQILKEASTELGVPIQAVNNYQFELFNRRRISRRQLSLLGGFGKLKVCALGKQEDRKQIDETIKVLERLAKYAS